MLILDTDHLSALDRGGPVGLSLQRQLDPRHAEVCTTIVSVSEQLRGLLAQVASARGEDQLIDRYGRLARRLDQLTEFRIMPWSKEAATVQQQLRRSKLRLGTMDLRIACIVLANNATLLSRNLRDFNKVPNLRVENWLD
jgi:tRNA(fMet)-specific endonuclease VapC